MDLSFGLQRKRQHTWVCLPTISQEGSSARDLETFSPPCKRLRTTFQNYPVAPDIVSDMDTLECDAAMELSSTENDEAHEWWKEASVKQGQQKLPMLDEDDLLCHVCDSIYKKPITTTSVPICTTTKPTKSILTYFKCTSKAASMRKSSEEWDTEDKSTVSSACTFCERSTCRNCLDRCEKCQKKFCRLCIRNDYLGNYSRVLCLDCADNGLHKDEAMNILWFMDDLYLWCRERYS